MELFRPLVLTAPSEEVRLIPLVVMQQDSQKICTPPCSFMQRDGNRFTCLKFSPEVLCPLHYPRIISSSLNGREVHLNYCSGRFRSCPGTSPGDKNCTTLLFLYTSFLV